MLPSPIRLSGVVTDNEGRPLSDVRIDHTGARSGTVRTDLQGNFDIETRAPAVVFRKNVFQSQYLRVDSGEKTALAITLAGPAPFAKECGPRPSCSSLRYFGSAFCLPKIHGVNVSKQGNDIDYGQRSFWITTSAGKVGVQHAAGPMWGSGLPLDEQVWSATEYTETSYRDREGLLITDARGKSIDGKRWRDLGHAFESASYRGVSEQQAVLLDRVLDGACVKPTWFPEHRR